MALKRLEKSIENAVTRWAHDAGIDHRKMNGLGNRSWPDQMFYSARFRKGVKAVFIEFKREGEEPTDLQWEKLEELQAAGFDAEYFDKVEEAKTWLRSFLK